MGAVEQPREQPLVHPPAVVETHTPQASTSSAPPPDQALALDGIDANGEALSPAQLKKQPLKMFRCTGFGECQMTFTRSEHLARHVRKHTGERPFKCHCGREFSRLDNVRQHAATVHSEQAAKNAETIASLVSLHNQLSASTVQRQRDAGMILQDNPSEGRSRRRAESANGDAKPKRASGKKKQTAAERKAREQAEAAEIVERRKAADQEAAVAAAQQRAQGQASPVAQPVHQQQQQQQQQPQQPQAAPFAMPYGSNGVVVPGRPTPASAAPSAYSYGAAQYPASVPSFNAYAQTPYAQHASQLVHQQMYAAGMAPPYFPVGMDMYAAAAAAAASYSQPPPAPNVPSHAFAPPPPSPHTQRALPTDPQQQQQQQQQANGRHNPPGPLSYMSASAQQPQPDLGQLTPNKISLPSISALLPSPFTDGQQQPAGRDGGMQPNSASSVDPHAAQHQQQQMQQQQQQQQYYAAMSAAQGGRSAAQMGMQAHNPHAPPPPHMPQHGMQQYGGYGGAGDMQHYQGQPGLVQPPFDPYARPSSTTSEREGPPSLSNGSSATSSSFQAGSPHHPQLAALPNLPPQHYSHMYNPSAAAQSAYQYVPPPQAQQPASYAWPSAQFLAAQQPFSLSGAAQGMYPPKYAMQHHQQQGAQAHGYGLPSLPGMLGGPGGRESSERGVA